MAALLTVNTDRKINAIKVIRTIMLGDKSLVVARDCVECGMIFHNMDDILRFINSFEREWKNDYLTQGVALPTWSIKHYAAKAGIPREIRV